MQAEGARSIFVGLSVSLFLFAPFLGGVIGRGAAEGLQALAAGIICLSVVFLINRREVIYFISSFLLLSLLVIFSLIPVLNMGSDYDLNKSLHLVLVLLVSCVIAFHFLELKNVDGALKIVCVFSLGLSLILLWSNVVQGKSYNRFGEDVANPIWVARAAGLYVLFFIYKVLSKKMKKGDLLAAIVSVSVMVLSSSRGPILAVFLSAIFMAASKGFTIKRYVYSFIFFILALGIVWHFMPDSLKDKFFLVFDEDSNVRILLYKTALEMIMENPIGGGLGAFHRELQIDSLAYPHNWFLECFSELGVFMGCISVIWIIAVFVKAMKICKRDAMEQGMTLMFGLFVYAFMNAMFSGDLTSSKEMYIGLFYFSMLGVSHEIFEVKRGEVF